MREEQVDFESLKDQDFDSLLGKGSGAGVIFGNTGGVMEAALRMAYRSLTGREADGKLPVSYTHLEHLSGKIYRHCPWRCGSCRRFRSDRRTYGRRVLR